MTDALPAARAAALGLSSADLADLGGFSDRFSRDLLAGRRPFPQDVRVALEELQGDIAAIADWIVMDMQEAPTKRLPVYHTNAALRDEGPALPGRGAAAGGFAVIWAAAVVVAVERLRAAGHEVEVHFA